MLRILSLASIIIMVLSVFVPIMSTGARSPAVMNTIQYRYFSSQDALFNALFTSDSAGGVDSMQWPLTRVEYQTAINNTGIVVEPMPEAAEFELGFNCNWTNPAHPNGRSAMNYTDFRQALACLVDKNGTINGPTLQGFATRVDTQIPQPVMSEFVNPTVSYPNYPWELNATNALSILYRGGWYNQTIYPTFPDLLNTYINGTLATYAGTAQGVVYPSIDPYGQWDGTDAYTNPRAGQPIDQLQGYVRTGDGRKDMGNMFCTMLGKIGINYYEHTNSPIFGWNPVTYYHTYDFATLGYSMGTPPNWWYSEFSPAGIYANGPNVYLVDDSNMTYWANKTFNDPTQAEYMVDLMNVQDILVNEAYLVSVYSPATYCAYKTGLLGQIDIVGQGTEANGFQTENWITLNSRKSNTINYSGPPSGTPESNTLYLGLYNPPDMINPIFQDTVFDFQVSDEMFTYPIGGNPYTIAPGSAITGAPSGGDLPWMAYAWTVAPVPNPTGTDKSPDGSVKPTWTNITLWFRNDITWQDGVPFTVADINYTMYINSIYGDAYDNSAMIWAANTTAPGPGLEPSFAPYFTEDGNPYTCSILVSSASWLNLYLPLYQVIPYHLYRYIVPSNLTAAEIGLSSDGLHGLWPGQAAVPGNVLPGAPFSLNDLWNKPETTLVGTGPFAYRVGSTSAGGFAVGGGITLDAYSGFFMPIAPGAVSFKYTWNSPSSMPSGGYFRVGLNDLVLLANAYGTTGQPPGTVPISEVPGQSHCWNPAADLASPSGEIGLSDLVTLALHYGWYYGNYSFNAAYPPSEAANGGP